MNVTYLESGKGACDYYRGHLPLKTLKKLNVIGLEIVEKGDSAEKIERALSADICVLRHQAGALGVKIIDGLRAAGKPVVIDYDDNLFEISPLSEHYSHFGTENVTVSIGGEMVELWVDGRNIDLKANRARLDDAKRAMSKASALTVTTERLAAVYSQFNENVFILPNCVDTNIWKPVDWGRERDYVRLYWSGGSSHYEDVILLEKVLPDIMFAYPNTKFVMVGQHFAGLTKNLPPDRVELHGWADMSAHPYRTMLFEPHISLIPLRDTPFNRCKSAIKWVEMAAAGVPSVTSYVPPYTDVYTEGNGVYVEVNDPSAWFKGIAALIEDTVLRASMACKARQTVLKEYDIHTQAHRWTDVYSTLL